tara:strand:- start:104 stop:637 length:534 start_codon:yes stop_codon:yes gene_type:complete
MRISLLVLGMIFMIGIFLMPTISAQKSELHVDQPIYEKLVGQSIVTKFFGYIDNEQKGTRVLLTITSPTGVESDNRIYPSNDGYFELFHTLDKYAELGMYFVTATYHGDVIGTTSFDLVDNGNYSLSSHTIIENEKSEIPSWVKNIFVWYGQDLVSEKELLSTIKFLVDDGIIILDS